MDPQAEQEQEIEVLRSIYPDELTLLSDTHFTLHIALDTATDRKHALLLDVKYPESYPEAAPVLNIKNVEFEVEDVEDSDSGDDEKFVSLAETIDFERDDLAVLLDKINEEAEMNIGMPSVFAVAALLKDESESHFQQKIDLAQKRYDEQLLAKEAEEQKKFHGTKVDKESFQQWRDKFRDEMGVEARSQERFKAMHNGKMSGRELFEKGLAGANEDDGDLADSVAKVEV